MIRNLSDSVLDSVSRTLSDAFSGTQITNIFAACSIPDTSGESTKWKRLYFTFESLQKTDRCANRIGDFIQNAMNPSRWTSEGNRERYETVRADLNRALIFEGLSVGKDGKLVQEKAAASLDEAHQRTNRLRSELEHRRMHPAILGACSRLLLKDDNFFHAAFEATKSVAGRMREISGLDKDGNQLVNEALERGQRPFPLVAFNAYVSETDKNEHMGITHLTRGLFFAFRNVTAHEPSTVWMISEQDALDMMSTASLVHRRLDSATSTAQHQPHDA
jgi:uncharacterized protein (TIGR02391 family)